VRLALVETSSHGGLLHYTTQLADGLAGIGHEVDLIVPAGNELARATGPARRRAVLVPHVRSTRPPPANRVAYQARRVAIGIRLVRSWARVLWTLRRGHYDAVVIGCDLSVPVGVVAMRLLLAQRRRPGVAVIVHNVRAFNRWDGEDLFFDRVERRLTAIYGRVDLIFVHGERSREEYLARWPERPIGVIPHGDERLFGDEPPPPASEERVLFFGDWRKVKGLPVLMAAFDLLVARRPMARLTIAGTPAPADVDPAPVLAWAASHGARVEVIDRYVPIEEVRDVFARARVVTTPYVAGYQSGVLHLAQTMARAVVTSDVGDLPSAVEDGVTGLVVPAGDAAALADALEAVISDPARADAMGCAAHHALGERASWPVVAQLVAAALTAELGLR
jgi:glycosyltransferase involved in cell wall biosynthesis